MALYVARRHPSPIPPDEDGQFPDTPLSQQMQGLERDLELKEPGGDAPMMQPLDEVLSFPEGERVQDLQIVTREFADGSGKFEAVHNSQLSRSLMSGSFTCASQGGCTTYEGTFLNDPHSELPTPSGQGVRRNGDGSVYSGQWKDGHPDGHGEWTAPPPSIESYLGEWKKGKKHGFGTATFANGDSYEGDWANGQLQDRGKYKYANGDEFMGLWDKGLKQSGTYYFADGRVSTRRFEQGRLVSCQDFDANRRHYQPTLSKDQVHNQEATRYGARRTPPGAF